MSNVGGAASATTSISPDGVRGPSRPGPLMLNLALGAETPRRPESKEGHTTHGNASPLHCRGEWIDPCPSKIR